MKGDLGSFYKIIYWLNGELKNIKIRKDYGSDWL